MSARTALDWLGWNGRFLRWRVDAEQSIQMELCIDGVVFERSTTAGEYVRDFPHSPSGNAQLEFSVRDGSDAIGTPWRVVHGHAAIGTADQWHGAPPPLHPLPATPLAPADLTLPAIAVIVPIFNSPELTRRCIEAALRWTPGTQLILIDDASTDAAIGKLLAEYASTANVTVLRNAQNLGYTRSCNRGIEYAGRADVVLLNSDTEVGPCWLRRLAQTAYSETIIGTVTAVSDNAGAFSVPELEQYCPIPPRWTLLQAQRALLQYAGGCVPELPTGNGFCMYVKRALIDRVGMLDADAFPAGYGEENDLCQRAEQVGFRHVIAGDVLVRHARSASFGAERRAVLGTQGMAVLRQRYPHYEQKIAATLWSFERRVLDYRVRRIYADPDGCYAKQPPRPRVLICGEMPAPAWREQFDCLTLAKVPADIDQLRTWLVRHAVEAVIGRSNVLVTTAAASLGVPTFAQATVADLVALTSADP